MISLWRQTGKHGLVLRKALWASEPERSPRATCYRNPFILKQLSLQPGVCVSLLFVSKMKRSVINVMSGYRPLESQKHYKGHSFCFAIQYPHTFLDFFQTSIPHERWSTGDLSPLRDEIKKKLQQIPLQCLSFWTNTPTTHTFFLFWCESIDSLLFPFKMLCGFVIWNVCQFQKAS